LNKRYMLDDLEGGKYAMVNLGKKKYVDPRKEYLKSFLKGVSKREKKSKK
jgi:hypothetical protein